MFTCKGCREVTRLVGEVEDLRQMMETGRERRQREAFHRKIGTPL